jgi:DhnA family fructose-bisphosphate aldolase class Ia
MRDRLSMLLVHHASRITHHASRITDQDRSDRSGQISMIQSYSTGKSVRLRRLFDGETGRSVIVAIDHGIGGSPQGLPRLVPDVAALLEGGPDGLILSAGALRRLAPALDGRRAPGILVTVDYGGGTTLPGGGGPRGEEHRLLLGIEDALRLGADGVKVVLNFGRESLNVHADNVVMIASLARAADAWGVPVLVEPVVWGRAATEEQRRDPQVLHHICRIAVELGADIVKLPFPSDVTVFQEIVRATPVPIVILGGPKMESAKDVIETARSAVAAGGAGVAFGRNVFQHPEPAAIVRALREAVHQS